MLTGGAGYIGSHVGLYLAEAGYDVIVFDNCSTGTPESVFFGELVVGDLSDVELLLHTLINHQISKVMHFAASISVPESVLRPLDYYDNNTRNTLNLLQCCNKVGVKEFVFSSTAAVYGQAEKNPLKESSKTVPINPYGRSKLMSEWMIQDAGQASNLNYVILRYFNVSGADSKGRIGSYSRNANHLIDNACNVVLHHQSHLKVFGIDHHHNRLRRGVAALGSVVCKDSPINTGLSGTKRISRLPHNNSISNPTATNSRPRIGR